MRLRHHRRRDAQRQAVIEGLRALKREFFDPIDQQYIDDMLLYAEIGRDRRTLDETWVAAAREHLENSRRVAHS